MPYYLANVQMIANRSIEFALNFRGKEKNMVQYSELDSFLQDGDYDGYLVDASSEDANQKYISGFDAPDPFITLYTTNGIRMLVSGLEYGRACKQSRSGIIKRLSEYKFEELVAERGSIDARMQVIAEFILEERESSKLVVPGNFPLETADGLRLKGIEIEIDSSRELSKIRSCKNEEEIEQIRRVQEATEEAMHIAEKMISEANIRNGILHKNEEILTSEIVKSEIELALMKRGCDAGDTIVASGGQGADPHHSGEGPLIANVPIIVDIFPQDKISGYHADMTRTWVKGTPSSEVLRRYAATVKAMETAIEMIRPGVTGNEIHNVVCDIYEEEGYETLRSNPATGTGFIHSTGHGVGLDIHEFPRINSEHVVLQTGNVITVEPGLYDPIEGGIRVEDLILVTKSGYENLTRYPKKILA